MQLPFTHRNQRRGTSKSRNKQLNSELISETPECISYQPCISLCHYRAYSSSKRIWKTPSYLHLHIHPFPSQGIQASLSTEISRFHCARFSFTQVLHSSDSTQIFCTAQHKHRREMVFGGQKLNRQGILRLNKGIQRLRNILFSPVSKKIRKDAQSTTGEGIKAALREPTTDNNVTDLDGAQLSHTSAT